ncbi:MAG TPA: two-component regulator propeller domain-containing protein, partial [Chitinophagaceae bacterium]|nr:two-component regulator propeller domain-containing protein [Chitinophagaceae bacterium]
MIRYLLAYLVFLVLPFTGRSQYVFHTLGQRDGLSTKEVYCTYRDAEGYVWFGTPNGLNRYDGSSFKLFPANSKAYPGLEDNHILSITGQGTGRIWVGTARGIFYFDKQRNRFTAVPAIGRDGKVLAPVRAERFFQGRDKTLWTITSAGVFRLHRDTLRPAVYFLAGADALDDRFCFGSASTVDTVRQQVWLATREGIVFFDYRTGEVYDRKHNPKGWKLLAHPRSGTVAVDRSGKVWFNAYDAPLALFDPAANTLIPASRILGASYTKDLDVCNKLRVDAHNRLWISSAGHQVYVLEEDGTLQHLASGPGHEYSLPYGLFHDVYEDPVGDLWVSTINGAGKLKADNYFLRLLTVAPKRKTGPAPWAAINDMQPAFGDPIWVC